MMCTRPAIYTTTVAHGRITIDICQSCRQTAPPNDDGAWAERHRAEATEAQTRIEVGT